MKNLFRPSYGGNRNYTLTYTLGGLMVSADDDMRPYTLMEHSPETLGEHEICRGRLFASRPRRPYPQVVRHPDSRSWTFLASGLPGAGQLRTRRVTGRFCHGLGTNSTKGLARENSLILERAAMRGDATVKIAQTFRSGTNDLDAIDYVDMFLDDGQQTSLDDLNDVYVLVNFRPL